MRRRILWVLLMLLTESSSAEPSSPTAYLKQGDAFLMADSYDDAIAAYEKGIALLSQDESLAVALSLETNLGTAFYSSDRLDDAAASYQGALTNYQSHLSTDKRMLHEDDLKSIAASAAFYLGMVYQDIGEGLDAVEAYQLAISLDPLHWSALANLGSVFQDILVNYDRALQAYNQAYLILANAEEAAPPTDMPKEPRFILSQLQYRIGACIQHFIDTDRSCAVQDEPDKAVDCSEMAAHAFSMALEYDADNEAARHMLATLTADATMKRASNSYVKSLFDDYAQNFEHSLVHELGYTGYERLRRAFDVIFDGSPPIFKNIVDAGCGTGLAGAQFRNITDWLIGVDLSQAIIDQAVAKRPSLYNETFVGDLVEVLPEQRPISLIIAADSFIYFGDLDPLFDALERALDKGSFAAFTLENVSEKDEVLLSESTPGWRWQLTPSGRFAHRRTYVEALAKQHGFDLMLYQPLVNFRYERGVGVRGHIFVFQKVDHPDEL